MLLLLCDCRYDDAIPDFEAVLKLNKDMAVAHVNLGLIYMLKLDNYHRSVSLVRSVHTHTSVKPDGIHALWQLKRLQTVAFL